ncbi:MAG: hypothetical protein NZ523_01180 [Elioraea sp.]|nr:hypothetical protein [Elioraea sp.]MDW8444368.1 hypothetical protein [Acetobacteraceae bacterium]
MAEDVLAKRAAHGRLHKRDEGRVLEGLAQHATVQVGVGGVVAREAR